MRDYTLNPKIYVHAEAIIEIVSIYSGVSRDDILGQRRHPAKIKARWIATAVYDELNIVSFGNIARAFHRRDHTSILHALTHAERFRAEINYVRRAIARNLRNGEPLPFEPKPEPVKEVAAAPSDGALRVVETDKRAMVFVPRKVKPRPVVVARRPAVVTGYLMGDPGERSARVDRREVSAGLV